MKYRVLKYFTDLQDNGCPYREGDTYPRNGLRTSDKRIAELMSSKNRQRTPLIEPVEESDADPVDDDTPKKRRRKE